jgi:hypothetical protein
VASPLASNDEVLYHPCGLLARASKPLIGRLS